MHHLEKPKTKDSCAVFTGSIIHGAFRSNQRSGMSQDVLWELGEMASYEAIKMSEDDQGSIAITKSL